MPTMERERGQPGVLRAGHTTFSSLQSLRSGNITPTDWKIPGEPSRTACHPVENHHHIHEVSNLLPFIHLWASQKPMDIQL